MVRLWSRHRVLPCKAPGYYSDKWRQQQLLHTGAFIGSDDFINILSETFTSHTYMSWTWLQKTWIDELVHLYLSSVCKSCSNPILFLHSRLLGQLREMETAFDGFWEKHQLKMEQYLQLWKFEQSFQEVWSDALLLAEGRVGDENERRKVFMLLFLECLIYATVPWLWQSQLTWGRPLCFLIQS